MNVNIAIQTCHREALFGFKGKVGAREGVVSNRRGNLSAGIHIFFRIVGNFHCVFAVEHPRCINRYSNFALDVVKAENGGIKHGFAVNFIVIRFNAR